MTPSPIRAENQRITKDRPASKSATAATTTASVTTSAWFLARMPLSMMSRSSSGFTTVMRASSDVAMRNAAMSHR